MQGLEVQLSSNETFLVLVHQSFDRVHCKGDRRVGFEVPASTKVQTIEVEYLHTQILTDNVPDPDQDSIRLGMTDSTMEI